MQKLIELISKAGEILWGPWTILFLIAVGLILACMTGFFHIIYIKDLYRNTIGSIFKKREEGSGKGISTWEAASTALAGSIGAGNMFGVATMIFLGGPGSVFWLWICAMFAMMLKYSEVVLCLKYRTFNEKTGEYCGGPMFVMQNALRARWLGLIFAIGCLTRSLPTSLSQASSAATAVNKAFNIPTYVSAAIKKAFNIPTYITSIVFAGIFVMVVVGGIKRIGEMATKVVPFMTITYILFALFVIIKNFNLIPEAFRKIFAGAFSVKAAAAGGIGFLISKAMSEGFSRAIAVSEAGLGSSPIAHAASDIESPVKQGQWGVMEVFINAVVLCTMTALVVVMTGAVEKCKALGDVDSNNVTLTAFSSQVGGFANVVIAVAISLFAITTIVGWAFYGEQSLKFIFPNKSERIIQVYRVIYAIFAVLGGFCAVAVAWKIIDIVSVFVLIPNVATLLILSPQIRDMTNEYKLSLKKKD